MKIAHSCKICPLFIRGCKGLYWLLQSFISTRCVLGLRYSARSGDTECPPPAADRSKHTHGIRQLRDKWTQTTLQCLYMNIFNSQLSTETVLIPVVMFSWHLPFRGDIKGDPFGLQLWVVFLLSAPSSFPVNADLRTPIAVTATCHYAHLHCNTWKRGLSGRPLYSVGVL